MGLSDSRDSYRASVTGSQRVERMGLAGCVSLTTRETLERAFDAPAARYPILLRPLSRRPDAGHWRLRWGKTSWAHGYRVF